MAPTLSTGFTPDNAPIKVISISNRLASFELGDRGFPARLSPHRASLRGRDPKIVLGCSDPPKIHVHVEVFPPELHEVGV